MNREVGSSQLFSSLLANLWLLASNRGIACGGWLYYLGCVTHFKVLPGFAVGQAFHSLSKDLGFVLPFMLSISP